MGIKAGAAQLAERDQDHVPEVKVLTTLGMFAVPVTADTTVGEIRQKVQEWKPEFSVEQIELVCKDKDAWGPLFNKTSRPMSLSHSDSCICLHIAKRLAICCPTWAQSLRLILRFLLGISCELVLMNDRYQIREVAFGWRGCSFPRMSFKALAQSQPFFLFALCNRVCICDC